MAEFIERIPTLFGAVLGGEFQTQLDPLGRSHTLARLAMSVYTLGAPGQVRDGRAVIETGELGVFPGYRCITEWARSRGTAGKMALELRGIGLTAIASGNCLNVSASQSSGASWCVELAVPWNDVKTFRLDPDTPGEVDRVQRVITTAAGDFITTAGSMQPRSG